MTLASPASNQIASIAQEDHRLRLLRFELVPRRVSEQQFWSRYFAAVNTIRRAVLPPCADSGDIGSGSSAKTATEHGSEAMPGIFGRLRCARVRHALSFSRKALLKKPVLRDDPSPDRFSVTDAGVSPHAKSLHSASCASAATTPPPRRLFVSHLAKTFSQVRCNESKGCPAAITLTAIHSIISHSGIDLISEHATGCNS